MPTLNSTIFAITALLMPGLVFAQSDQESEALTLEEVLVTAQKREQSLLEVPQAVTVISNQEIRDRAAMNIKDLQYSIPSLYITNNGPGQDRLQMRGLSPGNQGLPVVGVYLDEVGVSFDQVQRNVEIPLVDLERIEVLRGPQGTLYGQGSMGGTIKYITRNPDFGGAGFEAEAGVVSMDGGDTGYHAYGIANLPNKTQTFGVRLVAGYDDMPGWIDDAVTGEKDINSNRQAWFRGKALWQPNDNLKATLLWQHYDLDSKSPNYTDAGDPNVVTQLREQPTFDKSDMINLILDFDLPGVNLISSTGYLDRNLEFERDLTAFFGFLVGPGGTIAIGFDINFKVLTQEFRLSSSGDGPLSWTVGAWYRDAESRQVQSTPASPNPVTGVLDSISTAPADAKSWAVFGDVSYAFSPEWEASVGVRYYDDKRTRDGSSVTFFVPSTFHDTDKFDSVDPRFNLLWKYSNSGSAYINIAKGFRSGGFNTQGPPDSYDPEKLWNYEIGTRTGLLDNRLTIDTALYWLDYSNVQVSDVLPGAIFANTVNTGAASGLGFELAGSAALTDQLILNLTYSINDVTYDTSSQGIEPGDRLSFVPEWTWSGALTYRFDWAASFPGMFRVDFQSAGGYQTATFESEKTAYLNARIGVERENWQLYLEGKNLTNEDAVLFPSGGVLVWTTRPLPRSWGLLFRYQH